MFYSAISVAGTVGLYALCKIINVTDKKLMLMGNSARNWNAKNKYFKRY